MFAVARRYNGSFTTSEAAVSVGVETIGRSHEHRPLTVVTVAAGNPRRSMFVLGGQHGREWISPMAVAYFVHSLLHRYARGDRDATALLRGVAVHALAVLNPDGLNYTMSKGGGGHRRMWRRNRRAGGGKPVDLNRNWGSRAPLWVPASRQEGRKKAAHWPGASGFSEPETEAVRRYFARQRPAAFQAFADVHCCMTCTLSPIDFGRWYPQYQIPLHLRRGLETIGEAMCADANKIQHRHRETIEATRDRGDGVLDDEGYTLLGGSQLSKYEHKIRDSKKSGGGVGAQSNNAVSWAFHEANIPLSFSLETRGRKRTSAVRRSLAKIMQIDRRWITMIAQEIEAMCLRLGIAAAGGGAGGGLNSTGVKSARGMHDEALNSRF